MEQIYLKESQMYKKTVACLIQVLTFILWIWTGQDINNHNLLETKNNGIGLRHYFKIKS